MTVKMYLCICTYTNFKKCIYFPKEYKSCAK